MSIDEAINRFEKLASDYEFNLNMHKNHVMNLSVNDIERMQEYLEENRQLAEWLRELKDYKDRQDLINKSWQELINYKEGIEKIKMRSQAYRECGESILASGMEQALDILEEVNADVNT